MHGTKKIYFRADANRIIGSGHVMRCLSIAKEFQSQGYETYFILADREGDLLIYDSNMHSICINSDWSDLDKEIDILATLIRKDCPDLLIVDSYYVSERYFDAISGSPPVVYIDDLNSSTWNVDYLINYNIFGPEMDYSGYSNTHTKLFLGPRYAPLRDEFRELPEHNVKSVTDIMVSAGGADTECILEKLLVDICPNFSNISFHFVVGALNSRLDKIEHICPSNAYLHINEKNMSALMRNCDIAISAAGSTLYELCACGTPTITYVVADNQQDAACEFEKQGIMMNAGDCRNNDGFVVELKNRMRRMIDDSNLRNNTSSRSRSLVDGKGAKRIVVSLLKAIMMQK